MESNLKFIETWEVAQFKAQQGVEKLEVKQNLILFQIVCLGNK